MANCYSGFYKLSSAERLDILEKNNIISSAERALLVSHPKVQDVADKMTENSLGCYPLPLGLATNCLINGVDRLIPMATEESSVIAAINSAAKWLKSHGASVITSQHGWGIVGHIHFTKNGDKVATYVVDNKQKLIDFLNSEVSPSMHKRGGGFFDIKPKYLEDSQGIFAINVYFNPIDSMGANLVTQGCEALKNFISFELGIGGLMAIVSNTCDINKTVATVKVCGVERELLDKIVLASEVASADPWRACTHNKGIFNGIDAVAIATGNDWRAIEASLHSFACGEKYRPLATWSCQGDSLVGVIEGPLPVALVGGATSHPIAKICKKILRVNSAKELAGIFMAVGLMQNLAALKALVTNGLVAGHMRLHIENIMLDCSATATEIPELRKKLLEILTLTGRVTFSDGIKALEIVRNGSIESDI